MSDQKQTPPATDEAAKDEASKKELKADPKRTKLVKIKALRPIRAHVNGGEEEIVVPENQEVMVPEHEAEELCKQMPGSYGFAGERFNNDGNVERHKITRARRVS